MESNSSLFNWVNQYHIIASLYDLLNISTLVLFIENLFKITLMEQTEWKHVLKQITFNTLITLPASFNFDDQDQLLDLLDFIQTQYQYYKLHHHVLNNHELSFTSYMITVTPHHLNLSDNLIAWLNDILADYINASLISPIHDLLQLTHWMNGHYMLCILHYHLPSLIPDLHKHLQEDASFVFNKLFMDTHHTHPPPLCTVPQFLMDLIPYMKQPTEEDAIIRHQHLMRLLKTATATSPLSTTPSLSSTIDDEDVEFNAMLKHTMQNLKITKTITTTTRLYSEEEETVTEKLSRLLDQLDMIVPTRYDPQQDEELRHHLHPLYAVEEDCLLYERRFNALQAEFEVLSLDQEEILVSDLYETLKSAFMRASEALARFKRGYAFASTCARICVDLDRVQHQMVKSSITTQKEIQALEECTACTAAQIASLSDFQDLFDDDILYEQQWRCVQDKQALVQSWVDEVRVWFAEAERIRAWIEIRLDQIHGLSDAFTSEYQDVIPTLEKEMEVFDREDMARLRSHVKTLTGSNKDLSPADTIMIEITLTTLTMLDRLHHALRKKKYELQVLTQRVAWEKERAQSMVWLDNMDVQVEALLIQARWTPAEQEVEEKNWTSKEHLLQKSRLAHEKGKEKVVERLLALENDMQEFDAGQFTITVDLFQELDHMSHVALPEHLELQQTEMEQRFEDLMKRMAFARKVVEQRLNLVEFLHQTDLVMEDTLVLQMDLVDAELKCDQDRELTSRVQDMHALIAQLVHVTATRIPYPVPELDLDKDSNKKANDSIVKVVTSKRKDLILLGEDLDERLHALQNVLQLHRRARDYARDAYTLIDWADDRMKLIRRLKTSLQEETCTSNDLPRLQQEYDHMMSKLNDGKENEVIDLLTRIQLLLETAHKLKKSSMDGDSLREVSSHLQERFDKLQQFLEEYGILLNKLRQRLEDGKTYAEQVRRLREFISKTRHALPNLKQTCGLMTGLSQEHDQKKLDTLTESLASIQQQNQNQMNYYKQLCQQFQQMKSTDIEEVHTVQQQLTQEWNLLQRDIQDMTAFSAIVAQWHTRQQHLSMIEHSTNESDMNTVKTSMALLQETGAEITQSLNSEDPLQIANYSCARDRHLALTQRLQAAKDRLLEATESSATKEFLRHLESLKKEIQDHAEAMISRTEELQDFASSSMTVMDDTFNCMQIMNSVSEEKLRTLSRSLNTLLRERVKAMADEAVADVRHHLDQFAEKIQVEKKQAIFVRKVYVHAKAANDLEEWIGHCTDAISKLRSKEEPEIRRLELDQIERKMGEMKPTMEAFEAMQSRILTGTPLHEISLDQDRIKKALCERQAMIQRRWQELQNQHWNTRQWENRSIQGQEALEEISQLMGKIGDMNDRATAVRICRNSQLNNDLEHPDLNTILNGPLISIPSEHRLASAKAELDILDRDIDEKLNPTMRALSVLLESDTYRVHKREIEAAMDKLTRMVQSKRKAIVEAEKIASFIILTEEIEVLLLALSDVISRGSPMFAQKSDGQYVQEDLNTLFIDLDARYQYYEPKINSLFDEVNQRAEKLKNDQRVVECLHHLTIKWKQLKQHANSQKYSLLKLVRPLIPTDAVEDEGILQEKAKSAVNQPSTEHNRSSPSPQSIPSALRFQNLRATTTTPVPFALSATAARANMRRTVGGTTSPVERRVNVRQTAAMQQRLRIASKQPEILERYIADPKNELDVALGNILNDSPYKVKVKMVPGEVGKYWFGHNNPKLAYCRILRSRMVMVRVGGGWVELSQFLRDHALLEDHVLPGGNSLPTRPKSAVFDGYLDTSALGRTHDKDISMSASSSTPQCQSVPLDHGIKSGNKFLVAVDSQGNQIEVKMTKANNQTTKFVTPRRYL